MLTQSSKLRSSSVSCHDFAYSDHDIHEQAKQRKQVMHKLRTFDPSHNKKITYLLSASCLPVIQDPFTLGSLRTLLAHPHTNIILLIPSKVVVHPSVLKLANLPRAPESTFHVLPCDADDEHHDAKIVSCMTKFHKVKEIDGFMTFDRGGEHRYKLASIARMMNERHGGLRDH